MSEAWWKRARANIVTTQAAFASTIELAIESTNELMDGVMKARPHATSPQFLAVHLSIKSLSDMGAAVQLAKTGHPGPFVSLLRVCRENSYVLFALGYGPTEEVDRLAQQILEMQPVFDRLKRDGMAREAIADSTLPLPDAARARLQAHVLEQAERDDLERRSRTGIGNRPKFQKLVRSVVRYLVEQGLDAALIVDAIEYSEESEVIHSGVGYSKWYAPDGNSLQSSVLFQRNLLYRLTEFRGFRIAVQTSLLRTHGLVGTLRIPEEMKLLKMGEQHVQAVLEDFDKGPPAPAS